jgi:hypothetical protein
MPRDIIAINTTHYQGSNRYTLKLPHAIKLENAKLSLYSFSMYNSTYNISQDLGNNLITFQWFDGTIYNWTVPDGYYSVDDANSWLIGKFIENNLYVENSSKTQNTYFVRFQTNSVLYKNQIDVFYVPSQTEATTLGYLRPSGATWNFPNQRQMVQLTINDNLKKYFGMKTRTLFGNETTVTNYSYLSEIAPVISPVFSIYLSCNLVVSSYNNVANVFAQFPINVSYGSLIQYNSVQDARIDIRSGIYNEISVQLWDQNYKPLQFSDTEFTLFLIIETP